MVGAPLRGRLSWRDRHAPQTLRFKLIGLAERAGARPASPCADQFRDLPDVPQVVQRPLVEHLRQRDLPGFLVERAPVSRARRQSPEIFDICFALLFEVRQLFQPEIPHAVFARVTEETMSQRIRP